MGERSSPGGTAPVAGPWRPLRSRWLLALALVVVALASAVMWGYLTTVAVDETAKSFARADMPGEVTADLRPGTWNVYAEGPARVDRVKVTDGDGRPVEVTRRDGGGAAYAHAGFSRDQVTRVASFELPLGGEWPGVRIRVEGRAGAPGATFAVGADDATSYVGAQRWGIVALLAVNVGAAAAIVVVPLVRRRRAARGRDPVTAGAPPSPPS